jgi:pimeloyl-ACP methyl ester carboxylesterase
VPILRTRWMTVWGVPLLWAATLLCAGSCHHHDDSKEPGSDEAKEPGSGYIAKDRGDRVVVFVHGIFSDSRAAWTNPNRAYFPRLFADDPQFPKDDVYVFTYPTRPGGRGFSIDDVVSSMRSRLDSARIFTNHRRVVFVCHSLGGLIVERFLLTFRELAAKTTAAVLYGTPQTGSTLGRVGSLFSASSQLASLIPGDQNLYLQNLEAEWKAAKFGTILWCGYETRAIHGLIVVDRLSATRLCETTPTALDGDHVMIAKPKDRDADSYILLANTLVFSGWHSMKVDIPFAIPFSQLIETLERKENITIHLNRCAAALGQAKVPAGPMSSESIQGLLEQVRERIAEPVNFNVRVIAEGVRYEIDCY